MPTPHSTSPSPRGSADPASPCRRLELDLDALDCPVMLHGPGGELRAANAAAQSLLGLSESDIRRGLGFDLRWSPTTEDGRPLEVEEQPAIAVAATGQPIHRRVMRLSLPHRGRPVWIAVSATPQRTATGEIHRIVVTLQDISEQRRVRSEGHRLRVLLEKVLDQMSDGVLLLDSEGSLSLANRAAREQLSVDLDAAAGDLLPGELFRPDGSRLASEHRPEQRVFRSSEALPSTPLMWVGPSGRRRLLAVSGARLPSESTTDASALLVVQDTTLQTALQRASRHARNRLDAAMRAANLGRIDIRLDTGDVSVDRAWLCQHELPPEWAESSLDQVLPRVDPSELDALQSVWLEHLRGREAAFDQSTWVLLPDGARRRIQLTGQVDLRDAHGRALRLTGVLKDVTQTYDALASTRRMEAQAARLARMKGIAAVAGGVAHTFSNLLGGILGSVASLQQSCPPDPELSQDIALIKDSAERAALLTKQLRGMSGHGRFQAQVTPLSIPVQAMVGLLQSAVGKRGQVVVETEIDPPSVNVDISELRQVAVNLVLNAADADPRPTSTILVRTRTLTVEEGTPPAGLASTQLPAPGRYAVMEVRVRGEGMSDEVRAQMFAPFFTTRPSKAGLGLSAVLGIAHGHGGFVTIESIPGQGTTVGLAIPESHELPSTPMEPVKPAPRSHPAAKVLVVDDEPVFRRLVQRILRRKGYQVEVVADGIDALRALDKEQGQFDLVLLDLTMPGMSGHELLESLRSRWPSLPVVIMSGYTETELVRQATEDPQVDFLAKPFSADQLQATLGNFVAPSEST